MKYITKNLVLFGILLTVYSIIFRFSLSSALDAEKFTLSILIGIIYGVIIFITAWNLGKAHSINKFIFDAGLGFHITTYIVWGAVSEVWFILGFSSTYESIRAVHLTLIFWGLGLLLHFFIYWRLKNRTIKGVMRSDIFE